MGKSLDQVDMERTVKEGQGSVVDSKDVELAVRMGIKLLNEGKGLDVIRQAVNSSQDPAQVIGQFLSQIMSQLATNLQDQYQVDPKIFLAKGGWLEHMLDYIEKQLHLPSTFSDQVFAQTVEVIKAAAQHPPAPNNVMGQDPSEVPPPPGDQAPIEPQGPQGMALDNQPPQEQQ